MIKVSSLPEIHMDGDAETAGGDGAGSGKVKKSVLEFPHLLLGVICIFVYVGVEVLAGDGIRHLEWPIHSEILRARPDVNVVAHTHPFHATALSATTEQIRPYTNEGVWFPESVPHFKLTSDLVNTPLLGRELAVALGPSAAAVLLKNHGATFVGTGIREATLAGVFLERAARVQLTLAASGLAHTYPDADEIRQKRLTIYPDRAVENFWQYYNRKLDRVEGSAT